MNNMLHILRKHARTLALIGFAHINQFVCFLKGNMFYWYVILEHSSIDSWVQLEHGSSNKFNSAKQTVQMTNISNVINR